MDWWRLGSDKLKIFCRVEQEVFYFLCVFAVKKYIKPSIEGKAFLRNRG
jgi:hypothetical protein